MSKYANDRIYLILADSQITASIVNASTSKTKDSMPYKSVMGVTYRIVECELPCPEFIMPFTWYGLKDIQAAWDAL